MLTDLSLYRCDLNDGGGPHGVVAIAQALAVNTTLTKLNLGRFNSIGVEGAAAIAEALKSNVVLRHLDLSDGCIGVEGVDSLTSILDVTVLTSLNLSGDQNLHQWQCLPQNDPENVRRELAEKKLADAARSSKKLCFKHSCLGNEDFEARMEFRLDDQLPLPPPGWSSSSQP